MAGSLSDAVCAFQSFYGLQVIAPVPSPAPTPTYAFARACAPAPDSSPDAQLHLHLYKHLHLPYCQVTGDLDPDTLANLVAVPRCSVQQSCSQFLTVLTSAEQRKLLLDFFSLQTKCFRLTWPKNGLACDSPMSTLHWSMKIPNTGDTEFPDVYRY